MMRSPRRSRTWPDSKGSIMPWRSAMRRIHLSDLMLIEEPFVRLCRCTRHAPSSQRSLFLCSGVLNDDVGKFAAVIARAQGQHRRHAPRDVAVNRRHLALGLGCHCRRAAVGLLAYLYIKRQGAEKNYAVLLGHALAAALAEDVFGMAALAANVDAHVLDDAEHRHLYLFEHLETLAGVQQGDVLRRGDDDRAAHRDALRERELNITGARRQIHHEIVQVVPMGLVQ